MKAWMLSPTRFIVGALAVLALALPSGVFADAGGDNNAGDIWVDTVGAPPGPGHEMDPHLPCADINLWGDKLADASGTYTIDGWQPSGSGGQAYSSTWNYDQATGGSQVIDVINKDTLIAAAVANGDAPVNKQGFHFKIQFVQDPQKHKTFWIDCTASGQPENSGGSCCSPPPPGPTEQGGTQPTTTSGGQQGVLGERRSGRSHRRHKARRHHRHHRVKRHQAVLPAFTG